MIEWVDAHADAEKTEFDRGRERAVARFKRDPAILPLQISRVVAKKRGNPARGTQVREQLPECLFRDKGVLRDEEGDDTIHFEVFVSVSE
jgi:hypothetical protein